MGTGPRRRESDPRPAGRGLRVGSRTGERFLETLAVLSDLPVPGRGRTWERFETFASLAGEDLSLARLSEGHADALAILQESGRAPVRTGASYGVWAARTGSGGVTAAPTKGGWFLSGRKPFCSGSGLVDRALVTAEAPDGYRLFDVATDDIVVDACPGSWPAVGMADSSSETLAFEGWVPGRDAVGPPDFYIQRPGLWFGACGVAACWYGGARGLVAGVVQALGGDPSDIVLLEVGRAVGGLQAMQDTLRSAASAIDGDPTDAHGQARRRAFALRQVVHDCCEAILRQTAAAGGARPLCHDPDQARRAADLYVYLAQHHGGADAVSLGRIALEEGTWH